MNKEEKKPKKIKEKIQRKNYTICSSIIEVFDFIL
jgi:hypothetical protein